MSTPTVIWSTNLVLAKMRIFGTPSEKFSLQDEMFIQFQFGADRSHRISKHHCLYDKGAHI